MTKNNLYARFVVNITHQRQQSGVITEPKTKTSRDWVACFSEEAARLLVGLIKEMEPEELLFNEFMPVWYGKVWARDGIKDVTLKDLRRASIYWLGHEALMEPLHLMKHARHSSIDTTMLYCRKPEEQLKFDDLDLDA